MKYDLDYINRWIETDTFARKLLRRSNLTETQLKDYVAYIWNKDSVTYEKLGEKRGITKQAVSDNIRLAKENIDKAVATIILGIYANIIPVEISDIMIELFTLLKLAKEGEEEEFLEIRKQMMKLIRKI
ncbi:hypothetical protein J7J18_04040 [bacterium]|nr:hypothetical protein [Methanomicrobia archaeon]MCD6148516.1 hypothetical protein [bacterium]HDM23181.1 hypothetical protein [Methanomicrobia archaeon]